LTHLHIMDLWAQKTAGELKLFNVIIFKAKAFQFY
jgi:hypothetical protein